MKYLLLLLLGIVFIGCNDKKEPDSKMIKLGEYWIRVYNGETIQDAVMRLDKDGYRLAIVDKDYSGPMNIKNKSMDFYYQSDSIFSIHNRNLLYSDNEESNIVIYNHWCIYRKCPHFLDSLKNNKQKSK